MAKVLCCMPSSSMLTAPLASGCPLGFQYRLSPLAFGNSPRKDASICSVSMLAKQKGLRVGTVADNRAAKFNYEILDKIECGIILVGTEVKSCRAGKMNIEEGFARVDKNGALKLHNCHISRHMTTGTFFNHEEKRVRDLLAHKTEILKMAKAQDIKGNTLIPLRAYFNDRRLLKVEVGICRGKAKVDKREDMKKRDVGRDTKRELKAAGY
ncbi:hypothetical protein GUITHDRAFT_100325 [Guillardia theta CCMP2712]|uniref:SsrA-binding protein n=1 Tax=Guillardia theta (strain CCMP2712) TaxID=905079 RepID=L1JZP5_GUITC|nr:hypothetical protein GUITHDRAFT_100325 [Guillardia theta CCMP2712]EKX54076.1 hypothetical protein GUITHDRAFT_100325 [Guillardia theta CCMP2712]|eukprot:XP_005841056.1 hypothetical protein GUITHDRAFT_100325 [Guillardia theta CCMP2712]